FSWPGNVRQLESALLRFLISGEADFDDVRVTEDAEQNAGAEESLDLERYLALQRERRIAKALRVAGDDKNRAAKLLGISRATLYRELRRSSDSH
ncbi:MAG: helix-turn-helix domain-containing protein, partial [Hyphomicrobiaceae bacterium]